jgi:hypothetical protein
LLGMSQIKNISAEKIIELMPEKAAEIRQLGEGISNEAISDRIEKAAFEAQREAYLKITGLALSQAELAVLQPSLHSQTIMQLQKGERASELGSAMLQFKTFAIAMANQHMLQRASMMDNPMAYRLSVLALTTFFGGIGMLLGDLALGKDPRDITENPGKFGAQAMLKGGGLSVFGDIANAFVDETIKDPMANLAGPSYGVIGSALKLTHEMSKEAQGEDGKVAFRAIGLAREFLPFNNLIWTRAVLNNFLMSELNELANPGYMARMRESAEKNYNQEYYGGMGEGLRAPNLGNAFGQGR